MENTNLPIVKQLAQLDHVSFSNQVKEYIKEGKGDPLEVHLFLKRIEKVQEELKDDKEIKEIILKEADKHTQEGKTFEYLGAKITATSVHTSYDFSTCGDILWDNLNELFNQVKEMKESREKMLKAAFPDSKTTKFGFTAPLVIVEHTYSLVQNDCGEEVRLNAPLKRQVPGLRVSFPKS